MGRTSRVLALVLPIAGLAALWGWSDYKSRQGTDWLVPVAGYDPRDLLRGHYVEFTYDWPGELDEGDACLVQFCSEGSPPPTERIVLAADLERCGLPARTGGKDRYGFQWLCGGR